MFCWSYQKTLNTEYEIGIWIEAMFFMTWQENIEDSSVTYNEDAGQYKIVIKLKEFNLHTAKKKKFSVPW
ncbi:hypothetical protein HMSSN036_34290 [Paenibacillus macerans]|nr:hypothetical protein HMSSN036_34290 [Paenibacillus macerans]